MSQKNLLHLVIILLPSLFIYAQTENTLENQFDEVYNRSNNYQEYKVVKRADLNLLKKNTLDSITVYRSALIQMQSEIESQNIQNDLIQKDLEETNHKLEKAVLNEKSMRFLGIQTTKGAYNSIVWTIIGLLALLFAFFVYKFKQSNVVTKETKSKFDELEKEFESHRQRALEREQQLNRKLLDEINKHK